MTKTLVHKKADTYTIMEFLKATVAKAHTYPEGVELDAAKDRLDPALADMLAAKEGWETAQAALEAANFAVESQDEQCRMYICSVKDDIYTAHGRPRINRFITIAFPDGVETYTGGDPQDRPAQMLMLQQQVDKSASPKITAEMRKTIGAGLEAQRTAMEKVLANLTTVRIAAKVTRSAFRASGILGQEQLRLYKRDLENAGLSRTQIFDIIPDATPTPKAPKTPSTPTTPPPAGTDASKTG